MSVDCAYSDAVRHKANPLSCFDCRTTSSAFEAVTRANTEDGSVVESQKDVQPVECPSPAQEQGIYFPLFKSAALSAAAAMTSIEVATLCVSLCIKRLIR